MFLGYLSVLLKEKEILKEEEDNIRKRK